MIHLSPESDSTDGTIRGLAVDLTPMLDILFILLVFFMLTAGAVFQSLDLTLPSSVAEELTMVNEPKHIMLEIRKENYAIDGKKMDSFTALKQQIPNIIKEKPEHKLIIASDKQVPIEQLLKLLTYLQSQGIEAANILMKSENNS
jgi:biopolymer transport protein ExbD